MSDFNDTYRNALLTYRVDFDSFTQLWHARGKVQLAGRGSRQTQRINTPGNMTHDEAKAEFLRMAAQWVDENC